MLAMDTPKKEQLKDKEQSPAVPVNKSLLKKTGNVTVISPKSSHTVSMSASSGIKSPNPIVHFSDTHQCFDEIDAVADQNGNLQNEKTGLILKDISNNLTKSPLVHKAVNPGRKIEHNTDFLSHQEQLESMQNSKCIDLFGDFDHEYCFGDCNADYDIANLQTHPNDFGIDVQYSTQVNKKSHENLNDDEATYENQDEHESSTNPSISSVSCTVGSDLQHNADKKANFPGTNSKQNGKLQKLSQNSQFPELYSIAKDKSYSELSFPRAEFSNIAHDSNSDNSKTISLSSRGQGSSTESFTVDSCQGSFGTHHEQSNSACQDNPSDILSAAAAVLFSPKHTLPIALTPKENERYDERHGDSGEHNNEYSEISAFGPVCSDKDDPKEVHVQKENFLLSDVLSSSKPDDSQITDSLQTREHIPLAANDSSRRYMKRNTYPFSNQEHTNSTNRSPWIPLFQPFVHSNTFPSSYIAKHALSVPHVWDPSLFGHHTLPDSCPRIGSPKCSNYNPANKRNASFPVHGYGTGPDGNYRLKLPVNASSKLSSDSITSCNHGSSSTKASTAVPKNVSTTTQSNILVSLLNAPQKIYQKEEMNNNKDDDQWCKSLEMQRENMIKGYNRRIQDGNPSYAVDTPNRVLTFETATKTTTCTDNQDAQNDEDDPIWSHNEVDKSVEEDTKVTDTSVVPMKRNSFQGEFLVYITPATTEASSTQGPYHLHRVPCTKKKSVSQVDETENYVGDDLEKNQDICSPPSSTCFGAAVMNTGRGSFWKKYKSQSHATDGEKDVAVSTSNDQDRESLGNALPSAHDIESAPIASEHVKSTNNRYDQHGKIHYAKNVTVPSSDEITERPSAGVSSGFDGHQYSLLDESVSKPDKEMRLEDQPVMTSTPLKEYGPYRQYRSHLTKNLIKPYDIPPPKTVHQLLNDVGESSESSVDVLNKSAPALRFLNPVSTAPRRLCEPFIGQPEVLFQDMPQGIQEYYKRVYQPMSSFKEGTKDFVKGDTKIIHEEGECIKRSENKHGEETNTTSEPDILIVDEIPAPLAEDTKPLKNKRKILPKGTQKTSPKKKIASIPPLSTVFVPSITQQSAPRYLLPMMHPVASVTGQNLYNRDPFPVTNGTSNTNSALPLMTSFLPVQTSFNQFAPSGLLCFPAQVGPTQRQQAMLPNFGGYGTCNWQTSFHCRGPLGSQTYVNQVSTGPSFTPATTLSTTRANYKSAPSVSQSVEVIPAVSSQMVQNPLTTQEKLAQQPEVLSPNENLIKFNFPVTAQPTSANNEMPQPTYVNSVMPCPTSVNNEMPQSTFVNSAVPQPTSVNSVMPQPTTVNNEMPQHTSVNSVMPQPTSVNTEMPQPTSVNSEMPQPTSVNGAMPQPTSVNKVESSSKGLPMKPRYFDFLKLDIGTYQHRYSGTKTRTGRVKLLFNKRHMIYEFQLNDEENVKTTGFKHLVTIEIPFYAIIGMYSQENVIHLEVNHPPYLYLGIKRISTHGRVNPPYYDKQKPTDVTGGQIYTSPYHQITLKTGANNMPAVLRFQRHLELFDSRFEDLFRHPFTRHLAKLLPPLDRPLLQDWQIFGTKRKNESQDIQNAVKKFHSLPSNSPVTFGCSCSDGCFFPLCECTCSQIPCLSCDCGESCKNPLNVMKNSGMSLSEVKMDDCLMQNVFKISDLEEYLNTKLTFLCCNKVAQLKYCIPNQVLCPNYGVCKQLYRFSWCLGGLCNLTACPRYHCKDCQGCKQGGSKHCKHCNACYSAEFDKSCPTCMQKDEALLDHPPSSAGFASTEQSNKPDQSPDCNNVNLVRPESVVSEILENLVETESDTYNTFLHQVELDNSF